MSGIIQSRIEQIHQGKNPYFVAELMTGYVVLGDHQRFVGYTLFLSKSEATELHELPTHQRLLFLEEMALVAECVLQAFSPNKLNYELLGNGDPHMHWHIFPRRDDDGVTGPVWWLPYTEMKVTVSDEEMRALKQKLKRAILNNSALKPHIVKVCE